MNHLTPISRKVLWIALCVVAAVLVPARTANSQRAEDAQHGKEVFEKLGCFRCHGSAGEGMSPEGKEAGPPKVASTQLSLKDFVQSIRMPKGQMPPFSAKQVTDAELSDVYTFLRSMASQLKLELPSTANSQNGQHLYVAFGCYECHGYQGQGSVQTGGSRIGPPEIPFSGFVAYVRRPAAQMPPYTLKAVSDAQLADIYVFLQSRVRAAPSKSIPLLSQ